MPKSWFGRASALIVTLFAMGSLSGCVAVGYSTGGGWFVWPGGLGLLFILLLLFFLLRRRR